MSAKAQRTLPAVNTARPPSTSHLRPKRSESGPARSCPRRESNEEAAQRQAKFREETPRLGANPWKGRKDDVGGECAERGQTGEQEQDSPGRGGARKARGLRSKTRTSRLPAHDEACRGAMRVEPALGVLDPALQRDDGPAPRDHMPNHAHFAGVGEDRADKLGGGFM